MGAKTLPIIVSLVRSKSPTAAQVLAFTSRVRPACVCRARDPFGRTVILKQRHSIGALCQHGALVDVALVGDFAAIDGGRFGEQQGSSRVAGRTAATLRLEFCQPRPYPRAHFFVANRFVYTGAIGQTG
jgi:hypothetical protein